MSIQRHPIAGALGWVGVVLTVSAYLCVSLSILSATSVTYQIMNLTAAVFIATETFYKKDFQPFWLNVIWGSIALVALLQIMSRLS